MKITVSGNALVEMMLFMPLFLFFLFVVVDGGLALLDKAAIADSLRAGINTSSVYFKDYSLAKLASDGVFLENLDNNKIAPFLSSVAVEIRENVARALKLPEEEFPRVFKITTALVQLEIEPSSGILLNWKMLGDSVEDGSLNGVNGYEFVSMEAFLDALLEKTRTDQVSRYALPLGAVYNPHAADLGSIRYLSNSLVLYAEVRALTRGLNHSYVKSVLGRFYAVHEQEVLLLRTQMM